MNQDQNKKWEKHFHATFVFTKLLSFSHISPAFAEEKAAFAEYPSIQTCFGLIIGYVTKRVLKPFES